MEDARRAACAEVPAEGRARDGYRLVQPAPCGDEPVRRSRRGAQLGMAAALAVGAAFWAGVAVLAISLRR